MVANRDGHRALQVRVAGHGRLRIRFGALERDAAEGADRIRHLAARVAHVDAERRGDLVVARPSGVDLLADVAELPLDRGVGVLVLRLDRIAPYECVADLCELGGVEKPCRVQTLRMLKRRGPVVREQLRVVGAEELPDLGGELAADAAGPERHASAAFRSRAAASSTSIAASLMKPSAASCGNASSTPYDASACA